MNPHARAGKPHNVPQPCNSVFSRVWVCSFNSQCQGS